MVLLPQLNLGPIPLFPGWKNVIKSSPLLIQPLLFFISNMASSKHGRLKKPLGNHQQIIEFMLETDDLSDSSDSNLKLDATDLSSEGEFLS